MQGLTKSAKKQELNDGITALFVSSILTSFLNMIYFYTLQHKLYVMCDCPVRVTAVLGESIVSFYTAAAFLFIARIQNGCHQAMHYLCCRVPFSTSFCELGLLYQCLSSGLSNNVMSNTVCCLRNCWLGVINTSIWIHCTKKSQMKGMAIIGSPKGKSQR